MKNRQWWTLITQGLTSGQRLRTFSLSRGWGTEFTVVSVSKSEVIIAPVSTNGQRRLVSGTFEKLEAYLDAPSAELRKKTFNSSYGLGILKHLELI